MIGTNNTATSPSAEKETAETIKTIVAKVLAKHPESKVLLMPIFPREEKPDGKYRQGNEEINKLLRPVADGEKVIWLDINQKLVNADGTASAEVMGNDFLHPTLKGYQVWYDALLPYLEGTK